MRSLKLLCLLILLSASSNAQTCTNLVSSLDFQNELQVIKLVAGDQAKLNSISPWMNGRCILSDQARQYASLFSNDAFRLEFAKNAFPNLYDKENYYSLFDAFQSFSYALRFHDFVNGFSINPAPGPALAALAFLNLNYPSVTNYQGLVGCNLPMTENDFMITAQSVFSNQTGDVMLLTLANQFAQMHCISLGQLMKLATLLQLEINRSNFLTQNFIHCYDLENYTYAGQVFGSQIYKDNWNAFAANEIKKSIPAPPPPVVSCMVTETEMLDIKKSIENVSFASTKLSTAKQILQSKKCFSVLQVKQLVALMSFEGDKLDLAKYAWDFTTDRDHYYQVNDVFSFDSSKTELSNYVKGK